MAGPKKVDWAAVERAYVTEEKSARECAKEFGLSNSTVSAKQRAEDWDGKRLAYKNALSRRSYERIADSVSHQQAEIKNESILAARLYLRTFIKELNEGTIRPNAKDAALMIQLLVDELTPDNIAETKDAAPVIEVTSSADVDFLRRVLAESRKRVAPTGSMGPGLLVDPPATRTN